MSMSKNYLIVFTDFEDGEPSTHVRGLRATSDAEVTAAEELLRTQYDPQHLRSILVPDDLDQLFVSLELLRAQELERQQA